MKKPFLIAEISSNHCQKLSMAKKMIKMAKKYGADAVKIQTYTADSMTLNSNKKYFKIKSGLWKGYKLWDLYKKASTPLEWHKELFLYSKKVGITLFSTPFDENAVNVLEDLNCPFYKIASFEMLDTNLIKKVCSTKKPIIISTGLANLKEIEYIFNFIKKRGVKDVTILYCVSNYPSEIDDFNINNIKILKNKFGCKVGFSDHSLDNKVSMSAVIAGAEVIEKHIALGNQKKGLDVKFSLKGKEILKFRKDINFAYNLVKNDIFYRSDKEKKLKNFRRSVFTIKDIKKGEIFSKKNIKIIRPGNGLSPIYFDNLIGRKSPVNLAEAEPLSENILKKLNIKSKF